MARPAEVAVPVADLPLAVAPGGGQLSLGEIRGVQVLVLLRHRH
ncbi:MAG TPA: hypothetical protein VF834_26195 [Streptosporangiaceae bacterium]